MRRRIEIEESPYGPATEDFDGDGWVDFAVASDAADHVSAFLTRYVQLFPECLPAMPDDECWANRLPGTAKPGGWRHETFGVRKCL